MNPETGQLYRTEAEIAAARQRGEPLVMLSQRVADEMETLSRHERRRLAKLERKRRK